MKITNWPDFTGYRNIELGLTRVYELLNRLENPQNNLPPTIHIAGTNGKGSTLSFLRTIFQEAGLKTHTYTSPHLVNFNERIILANQEISDDFLNECLLECKKMAEKSPKIAVTFFEGITVAAFLAFSKIKADILLLEVGMGGRLDATNILSKVLCSVITPISMDHTDFLGNSLEKIATEKAGIIKKNCPTIIGKQEVEALNAIETIAKKLNSKTKIFNQDWQIKKQKNGFSFKGFKKEILFSNPSLFGDHQIENASLAIATALSQNEFEITTAQLKNAIKKTFWPARLQKINYGKFFNILPNNFQIYLDGGHNVQAALAISNFLKSKKKKNKIYVIFSMLKEKDCDGFLKEISSKINHLITTNIKDEPKALKAIEILKIAKKIKVPTIKSDNLQDAFEKIIKIHNSDKAAMILICGSLYLAGNFLEENYN